MRIYIILFVSQQSDVCVVREFTARSRSEHNTTCRKLLHVVIFDAQNYCVKQNPIIPDVVLEAKVSENVEDNGRLCSTSTRVSLSASA
jgi:hypothetical protein